MVNKVLKDEGNYTEVMEMPLVKVTATGPDDTTPLRRVITLLHRYPKAEFGILVSSSQKGLSRFPSEEWIDKMYEAAIAEKVLGRFSMHVCGKYVRELLSGNCVNVKKLLDRYKGMFSRAQINTHGEKQIVNLLLLEDELRVLEHLGVEFIFQRDGVNDHIFDTLCQRGWTFVSTLFDLSAGAGILPQSWPPPIPGRFCGYAGGLSPDNVEENIKKIEKVCKRDYWIDAEGRLMADDGHINMSVVNDFFFSAGAL